jgi:ring-1,2-phenylacetyl-CoA epoxidase subunit PaaD
MVASHPPVAEIWDWLREIPDPEIPVLSIVDLGIVRDVQWSEDERDLVITVTPTYSGCPAMDVIVSDIRSYMKRRGIEHLRLETRLSPPWTTDWMSDEAKNRLQVYGIAPPPSSLVSIAPECPHCGSRKTELVSQFGSTPCKSIYRCLSCLEPFDVFKRH